MPPDPRPARLSPSRPSLPQAAPGRRRWWPLAALTLAVLALHLWLTHEVSERMAHLAVPPPPGIQRMQATYVSEVKLSAPPVAVAAPPSPPPPAPRTPKPAKKKKKAVPPPEAASAPDAPEAPASEPEHLADTVVAEADAPSLTASSPETQPAAPEPASAPSEPASAPQTAALPPAASITGEQIRSGPAFVWPRATRVRYKLEGNYRGPFYGNAYVEWVRQGTRYQVHMEASVAILGGIRMTSEGTITPQGLSPQRYESVNRMLLRSAKVNTLRFEDAEVVLSTGERVARAPDMQDPVSQLIHLAYQFMMRPEQLRAGNSIEIPIAWTKRTEALAYDVIGEEKIATAIGEIPAVHVKPRRLIQDKENLSGEIWFAPGLQYLPVRIYTRWSDEFYLDMRLEGAPQQTPGEATARAAPPAAAAASSTEAGTRKEGAASAP